jgi:twitching motility two-component system response regulator PilH
MSSVEAEGGGMPLVLIVDDSPTQVHVLKSALERHGFDIATAVDGREGVDMARRLHPDLILMDVVMPKLNGFQATRELARDPQTRTIPVVMVTTKQEESDRVWGLRQGAVDFLVKPVSEADLLKSAHAAMVQ